jgi:predicted GNAT family N-acyltransferase
MRLGVILHFSEDYHRQVQIRREILRLPLNLDFTEEELALEANEYHLGAWDEDNNLVAVLSLKPLADNEIKMRQVAVKQSVQKSGIGKLLVLFAEQFALSKGYTRIVLNARDSAIDFYLFLNYSITGPQFKEVGLTHSKMFKNIA